MKNETFFKMSIIPVIQMLQEKINNTLIPFNDLINLSYSELEIIRDNKIKEYNKTLKNN